MPHIDGTKDDTTTARLTGDEPIILILISHPYYSSMNLTQDMYKLITEDLFTGEQRENIHIVLRAVIRCPTSNLYKDPPKEPGKDTIRACSNYLAAELSSIEPDVIVCLGKAAAMPFGIEGRVKDMYNQVYDVAPMNKFNPETLSWERDKFTKPAKLLVTKNIEEIEDDLDARSHVKAVFGQACRLALGGSKKPPDNYNLIESAEEFSSWVDEHLTNDEYKNIVHAFDIETNGRDIHPKTKHSADHPPKLRCVSFSWAEGNAICVPYEEDPLGYYPSLKRFLESDTPFTGHNVSFDIYFLKLVNNIHTKNLAGDTMLMAYLMAPGKGKYGYGLKPLAARYTDLGGYETDMKSTPDVLEDDGSKNIKITKWEAVGMGVMAPYNCADADATLQLYKIFKNELDKRGSSNANWIMTHALFVLADMEHHGFKIDREWVNNTRSILENYQTQFEKEMADLRPNGNKGKQYDWGSSQKVLELLELEFSVDIKKILANPNLATLIDKDKEDSVGDVVLAAIDSDMQLPIAGLLRKWRKVTKLLSTYFGDGKDPRIGYLMHTGLDDRLRADFSLLGTATGRLSSSGDANLQNIPSGMSHTDPGYEELHDYKVKKAFIPSKPGRIIVNADQSQLELRIAGAVSGDEKFIESYVNGIDMHSRNALVSFKLDDRVERATWELEAIQKGLERGTKEFDIYVMRAICKYIKRNYPDERQAAKKVSFGILYGMGPFGLAMNLNREEVDKTNPHFWSVENCKTLINAFKEGYPTLISWQENTKKFASKYKFVRTHFGRYRFLPELMRDPKENPGEYNKGLRRAINTPIQSCGSDFMMAGVSNMRDQLDPSKFAFLATVHDSVVCEVDENYLDEFCKVSKYCLEHPQIDGVEISLCKDMPFIAEFEIGPNYGSLDGYEP